MGHRLKLLFYPLVIYILGVAGYSVYRYNMELNQRLIEIDRRLLIGASQIKYILPAEFPSRCKTKTSITPEEHLGNMDRLNSFVNSGGYEYFYTIHMINGEMYYTSTSYADDEDPSSPDLAYCYSLKDSGESHYETIKSIFDSDEPVFFNNEDQWGSHRSCMMRQMAPDGTYYLSGADYETSYIRKELWSEVPISIATAFFFLLMATPFMYFINSYWLQSSNKLKELNAKLQEDVDFRKRVEEDLVKAKGKAEIAVETQKAFLANISHEIRTPMNGIMGMSELLKKSNLTEEQKDSLQVIEKSSRHLLKIIEDLLNYSRLDAKDIELEIYEVSPAEVLECCFDLLQGQANSRNVTMKAVFNTDRSVHTDQTRLNQILLNLVGNAIKFSKNSEVKVTVSEFNDGKNKGLLFKVSDKGVGIDQGYHTSIFEPFVQVDTSSTREFHGAGLGLAITKKLCEKLGGGIKVESEIKQGSTFIFSVYDLENKG